AVEEASGELPPRDVAVVVQPSAARMPPLPDDFEHIDHGWLSLEFPSSVRPRVAALVAMADEIRSRLAEDTAQPVLDRVLVRVVRSPQQMAELAPDGAPPLPYAAAMAYPSLRVAILAMQAPDTWEAPDLGELLAHELTHLALSDATAGHHVPRWFDEGLAIHESGEEGFRRTWALWQAAVSRRLLPLDEIDREFPTDRYEVNVAYAESADFVRYLMRDSDRARFGSLVQRVRAGTSFDRALDDAYGTDVRKLEYEWREDVGHRFSVVPMLTGGGVLWSLIAGLTIAAWVRKRRHAKAKLAQWAREEAEADAAQARALRPTPVAAGDDEVPPRVPSVPVVEHEGRWYTLH
ncbi:MAG TPA: peptidase MA family metallohydrolase, partial [Polyangiaceae bacterium]|nr:peptidase MA family metallohydrolase [Polyangiaceae bacterium]